MEIFFKGKRALVTGAGKGIIWFDEFHQMKSLTRDNRGQLKIRPILLLLDSLSVCNSWRAPPPLMYVHMSLVFCGESQFFGADNR